jgi:hypothetical protein
MSADDPIPMASLEDLESFKAAELTSVTACKFSVTLTFNDEPRTITVESGIEFRTQGRTEVYNQEIIVAFGARILSLMGRRVVELKATDDKVLSFEFDEGSVLTLRPDDTGTESYAINLPDGSVFTG